MNESPPLDQSDFLGRIIDKAFGGGSALQPRLPSLFEPAQGIDVSAEMGWQADTSAPVEEKAGSRRQRQPEISNSREAQQNNAPAVVLTAQGETGVVSGGLPGEPTKTVTTKPERPASARLGPSLVPSGLLTEEPSRQSFTGLVRGIREGQLPQPSSDGATHESGEVASMNDISPVTPPKSAIRRDRGISSISPAHEERFEEAPTTREVRDEMRGPRGDSVERATNDIPAVTHPKGAIRGVPSLIFPAHEEPFQERLDDVPTTGEVRDEMRGRRSDSVERAAVVTSVLSNTQRIVLEPTTAPYRPTREGFPVEMPEAHPAPVVNVTIGRIEVRAAPAPAPRQSTEARGPKPMSLDEYLKQRGSGR